MMQHDDLVRALEQIRSVVDAALGTSRGGVTKIKARANAQSVEPSSLPDHLLKLREAGFFKQPKTYNEAHDKLSATYPCEPARVRVALLRLQQAKQFRKASKLVNGRKQNAYVW